METLYRVYVTEQRRRYDVRTGVSNIVPDDFNEV